jgi:hypothetical protein
MVRMHLVPRQLDNDAAAVMQADGLAEFSRQADTPGRRYSPMNRIHGVNFLQAMGGTVWRPG